VVHYFGITNTTLLQDINFTFVGVRCIYIEVTNEQKQQFLYLSTKGWKTGREHRIEIWFVVSGDKYYVISEHKEKAHWVQNVIHNPRVMFTVNSKSFEGAARIVDKHGEPKLAEEVSSLMHTKYGWSDGLIVELAPSRKYF
jgi:deazaflavin-dependent oxidoreductase (nitroreductase family)